VKGYDTPQLYREDTLEWIHRQEAEINKLVRDMNETIRKGRLPEKPIPIPFPGADDDPVCE
jgi:hypothetical protein